ncbi:enoyl-CoA hydratase/isomerase family protein [Pseudomonas sp. BCA14]|uniref:enoyl-CoA hydratase/isomerase family protein n=1 Tax=unclassified Pseudomonas TaxID=196821 RepID=UPI00106EE6CB|nr:MULTISPECIES: enoyl-CoA hydratase/isomerase family protein [unclassified Pseudomonas]TFF09109.1 enoyl-CoA hydratase/isomerase family protein [Pseudomonas sp. BCA17]TFF09503.1 enoyl-CoA hydratase/isomerase family protein [Pseudomonas sp. JMN1]TFF28422.1 enoyl-CoA hydratase/isomerase family protein [Pseudomonas sp. BCA14]TFF29263.1 enoyl-CoA hydratase/isomerase family protein [Pseudomonas sp. BCA13]
MNLHFEELTCSDGTRLGIASLDAEKSLNALSLPMILALSERLEAWAKDPHIVCVLLRGNGPKAFCAGGEVRSLAQACREQTGVVPTLAAQFFAAEYRLDYRLHTYPKPLICWGHGYVLGGGMGLLQSAAVRIVTPSSRLAMPEISIGLYPDVGAGWFLSRLPGKLGLFLGLTGAHINGRDALDMGLADRFLRDDQQEQLIDGLLRLNWQEQTAKQLNSLLKALSQEALGQQPEAQWLPRRAQIDEWLDVGDVSCAWRALSLLRDHSDPLLNRAGKTLSEGCPLTAHLVWEHLRRARHLSLAQVFQVEYTLSLNCCRHPEFAEGVRARLIDKDQAPHWHWPAIDAIPDAVVQAHFNKAWEGRHPLADLSDY